MNDNKDNLVQGAPQDGGVVDIDTDSTAVRSRHQQEISLHVARLLGVVDAVFPLQASNHTYLDMLHVKPTAEWPYHRLVTSGMSERPMPIPNESGASPYMELMMTLPGDWQINEVAFSHEQWYWPVQQLKFLADFPHRYATWLGYGHTVPNGEPPKPYSSTTEFTGVILLPSVTVNSEFHSLVLDDGRDIRFMSVIPLYAEEMMLKLNKGTDELMSRFDKREVTDIVDTRRLNVGKKRFGLF